MRAWPVCITCAGSPTATHCEAAFAAAQRVAIIGAGWIGLETAAAAPGPPVVT